MSKATTTNCHGTSQNVGPSSGGAPTRDLQKDVLNTFHQFSNDEVLTPPWLAEQMLSALPKDVWCNPDLKWLDIACKSGVFLREAAFRLKVEFTRRAQSGNPVTTAAGKKLVTGTQIVDHILGEMLYGVAVTNLMAKVSRRVLYSSVDATHPTNSAARRIKHFGPDGNIRFVRASHNYNKDGSCEVCGYSEAFENGLKEGLQTAGSSDCENYAYELIHPIQASSTEDEDNEEEATKALFKDTKGETVKFDVIIGNPPYQMADSRSEGKMSAKPLYNKFIEVAKQLNPRYMTMIVPARWYAGGKGLDDFRAEMINDHRVAEIHDFPNASEVFPDNEIKGGVMYFLWDSGRPVGGDEGAKREPCKWVSTRDGETSEPRFIDLRAAKDVILRDELSLSILAKVQKVHGTGKWMDSEVQARKPFGLATDVKGHKKKASGDVVLFQNGGTAFYPKDKIAKNVAWVDKHKALLSNVGGDGMKTLPNLVSGKPFVGKKGSACTETYLVAGLFDTKEEADRRVAFMKTKFFRLMLSLRKITIVNARGTFAFVPVMDNDIVWTDVALYEHFGLTQEEIDHIEATVKVMP